MRIFSTKSFLFTRGNEEIEVQASNFADVPDWVADTSLFKLAKKDKSVSIMENAAQQKQVENTGKLEQPKQDDESEQGVNLNNMSVEELKEYADKKGIDLGKSTSKEGILAKIKDAE